VCKVQVDKCEGKRHLGRPSRRWEDSVKMDQETRCEGTDEFHLAQDGQITIQCPVLLNTIMNTGVP
jgi:hypothetical protein